MEAQAKAYKGMAMEGWVATWYARNTARDHRRFEKVAAEIEQRVPAGSSILEVAPGPGYLAIRLARSGRRVTGLDISKSFVEIAGENARKAGVAIEFRQGNASQMPFADESFDFVVCMAAFKNFADPVSAINEMHRVLRPGGQASIYDLRKEASAGEIAAEVQGMNLSAFDALMTKWIFRTMLLRRAYTEEQMRQMAAQSRFGRVEIVRSGVGFEARFTK